MDRLGVSSTVRASFALYNGLDDVERLAEAVQAIVGRAGADRSVWRRVVQGEATDLPVAAARSGDTAPAEQVGYPVATASSPREAAYNLAEDFELLPDWPSRHAYIMDLGERLPPMPEALKTGAHRVQGCQSTVYLDAIVQQQDGQRVISFLADSDAAIVRGLIALLQRLFAGQSSAAIRDFDLDRYFASIGLDQHLSLSRRNGLSAMVQRIQALARADAGSVSHGA